MLLFLGSEKVLVKTQLPMALEFTADLLTGMVPGFMAFFAAFGCVAMYRAFRAPADAA